jgi:hypothetical protein
MMERNVRARQIHGHLANAGPMNFRREKSNAELQ